jgi:hypothetical protein
MDYQVIKIKFFTVVPFGLNLTLDKEGIVYLEVNTSSVGAILSGTVMTLPDMEPRFKTLFKTILNLVFY